MQLMCLATIVGMATATIDVIKKSLVGCLTDHGHFRKRVGKVGKAEKAKGMFLFLLPGRTQALEPDRTDLRVLLDH